MELISDIIFFFPFSVDDVEGSFVPPEFDHTGSTFEVSGAVMANYLRMEMLGYQNLPVNYRLIIGESRSRNTCTDCSKWLCSHYSN